MAALRPLWLSVSRVPALLGTACRRTASPAAALSHLHARTALSCNTAFVSRSLATSTHTLSDSSADVLLGLIRPKSMVPDPDPSAESGPSGAPVAKINLHMRSWDYAILDSYVEFVRRSAKQFGITVSGRVCLPTHIQRFTVLKSPHVFKKHRAQYEIRTHKRLVQIRNVSAPTADTFVQYIEQNSPPGVSLKVTQQTLESGDYLKDSASGSR